MFKTPIFGFRRGFWLAGAVCVLLTAAPAARSQQSQNSDGQSQDNQPTQPIPAYKSPFSIGSANNDADQNSQNVSPDTRPLSGAQYLSVGNLKITRSYWQPQFNITGSADSNPQEGPGGSGWGAWTSFTAGVDIHRISGASQLSLNYTGGGMYSSESFVPGGTVQELGFSDSISFRRAILSVIDELSYLPQAGMGFGGLGGLPSSGIGSTGLGPGETNGQTILTGQGQNLENSSVVQLETFLTPRSSITLSGGYALLHFFGSNLNLYDSANENFQGGYNYQLTKHNTLAVIYGFNHFSYSSTNESINTHTVQAAFSRRLTGRLMFEVGAGPSFTQFNQGAGTGTSGGGTGPGLMRTPGNGLYWSLNSALDYQYEKTGLGLTYWHGISSGSGVVLGSISDLVTGSITRKVSKNFSSGISGGYSRNSALFMTATANSGENYNYWFAGATLARPLSSTLALTLSYQMQYQNANGTFCIGQSCGSSLVRHLISVGLSWQQRPLLF
jgi:hypothetical protein